MKLDKATCEAIAERLDKEAGKAKDLFAPDTGLMVKIAYQEAATLVRGMAQEQQPPPAAATPSAGAMRAATPIWNGGISYPDSLDSMATLIDRETGLPKLVAALEECARELETMHSHHYPDCQPDDDCPVTEAYEKAHAALAPPTTDPEQKGAEPR